MSYSKDIHRIALNLLLPPESMTVTRAVAVMNIPYTTLYKWKKDAESDQGGKKRQGKSTTPTVCSKLTTRIKRDSSRAPSQSTRARSGPVQNILGTPIGTDPRVISKGLAEDY
jgi:hypothetical protein